LLRASEVLRMIEGEFKRVDSKITFETYMATHSFVGGSAKDDVYLGVRHPPMLVEEAKEKLRENFGDEDVMEESDKVTFEYTFTSSKCPNVFFRIYDYKGCMSCGLGVPHDKKYTQRMAKIINNTLERLLTLAYSDYIEKEEEVLPRRVKIKKEKK
jgi:hypothetical protein